MEIERKYLVNANLWKNENKGEGQQIIQAYVLTEKEKTIRIRIYGKRAFLTLKGESKGISREEFEYEIPLADATKMMELFTNKKLSKTRYEYVFKGKKWEIDEFEGNLKGLIIAEIELESENEVFEKPKWIDKEVSDDPQYFNALLIEKN